MSAKLQSLSRRHIVKRLSGYWRMEAANVVFIPATIAVLALYGRWQLGPATIAAMVPMCLLLAIGGAYWRSKLDQLRTRKPLPDSIGLLARLQTPSALLTLVAVIIAAAAWHAPGLTRSTEEGWIVTLCAVLAALEYVNYYHRQLQHFDHLPDLKRLVTGRGFRRSQMAADIARWRALK